MNNTFGRLFTLTTFGESHGELIGCVVDGCPAGFALSEQDIQPALDCRRPGQSRYTSQRKEADLVRIVSGVFEGKTTGTPITLLIDNQDPKAKDYMNIATSYRPGHADFTYDKKYGHRDYRGGGRASARETAMRVAAGAIAQKYLFEKLGVKIHAYLAAMGDIRCSFEDLNEVKNNPFFCPNTHQIDALSALINALRKEGDSIGARVNVIASQVPIGLGEPVYDKLDARLAQAMMSINAVKGVEIGEGFGVVEQRGTQGRDEMDESGFLSNHAGGILAGISSGQDIKLSVALKPTSSLTRPAKSINQQGEVIEVVTKGRHDPCVGIRAVPVVEAMMALTLMDFYLMHKARSNELF